LYDRLTALDDSPVVALNRAVAVAAVHGPQAGIDAIEAIDKRAQLESYYLLYAALGEFEARLGRRGAAADYFRRALELVTIESEQVFLTKKLRELEVAREQSAKIQCAVLVANQPAAVSRRRHVFRADLELARLDVAVKSIDFEHA